MIRLLISGRIHGAPQSRLSASGSHYVTAELVADNGEAPLWVSLIAFADVAERLLRLRSGDTISASGRATFKAYESKSGSHKIGVDLVADEVLTLKSAPGKTPENPGGRHG